MTSETFRPKAYIKEGCPFSFKFLLFMTEAGWLDRIEIVRLAPDDPSFETVKGRLSQQLGKAATFPTVEVDPGRHMTDSDRLIEHFAERSGLRPDQMPVLSLYKQTIFPKLIELHKLKSGAKS